MGEEQFNYHFNFIENLNNNKMTKKSKVSCEFIETILKLKDQVLDLNFIVNHLKEDILCTLENSKKTLQFTNEREIGILVYSLMEEFFSEKIKLTNSLNVLQKENLFLIENEETLMDELAKITIENEQFKIIKQDIISTQSQEKNHEIYEEEIKKELEDLESELKLSISAGNRVINNFINVINTFKKDSLEDKNLMKNLQEDHLKIKDKLDKFRIDLRERVIEIEKLKSGILKTKDLLKSENEKRLKLEEVLEARDLQISENNRITMIKDDLMLSKDKLIEEQTNSIMEYEIKFENLICNYTKMNQEKDDALQEHKSRSQELMEINIELMDLSEAGKIKEIGLEKFNDNYRIEIEALKIEIEKGNVKEVEDLKIVHEKEIEDLKIVLENEIFIYRKQAEKNILENEIFKNEINNLKTETEIMKEKIDCLNSEKDSLNKEIKNLNKEIEHFRKSSTSQKIELEKSREIISRERRMSSLKISDLEEQLEYLRKSLIVDTITEKEYIYKENDTAFTYIETEANHNDENTNMNVNVKIAENKSNKLNAFEIHGIKNMKENKLEFDPFLEAKERLANLEAASPNTKEECLQQ